MSRLANAILTGAAVAGYTSPMVDIRNGGQNGYSTALAAYASNQAYVQRNLIALLIEAPQGFQYLPDSKFWVEGLKAIVETHPKSISGMARGLSIDYVENSVGGGGEVQHDMTDVKRAQTTPSFTWVDKLGRPIQTFMEEWVEMLMADPDSKVAGVVTLAGKRPTDLLSDMTGMTCLFFEPDPTHQFVVKAWLSTNMMPKTTGDSTGKRELSSAMESGDLTIEFTATSSSTLGVRMFAQTILNSINFANANPNLAPAFMNKIDAQVAAASTGYAAGVNALTSGANTVATRG